MKTSEEIVEALRCCNAEDACDRCPYNNREPGLKCLLRKNEDAARKIEQLETTIADSAQLMSRLYAQKGEAETRVAKLETEINALLEHLRSAAEHGGVCIGCKYALEGPEVMQYCENIDFDCENCEDKCPCHSCEKACNYEWVGVSG